MKCGEEFSLYVDYYCVLFPDSLTLNHRIITNHRSVRQAQLVNIGTERKHAGL